LASGKGVLVPETKEEAIEGVKLLLLEKSFGSSCDEIVIEEKLYGPEISGTINFLYHNF
jgi:phosphoribosylamine--glycine ligase/phosphoribosylformylglycinamidine cyclo-ligase